MGSCGRRPTCRTTSSPRRCSSRAARGSSRRRRRRTRSTARSAPRRRPTRRARSARSSSTSPATATSTWPRTTTTSRGSSSTWRWTRRRCSGRCGPSRGCRVRRRLARGAGAGVGVPRRAAGAGDVGVFGCALISDEPDELLEQLGEQVKALLREHALDPREALEEVAEATAAALEERGRLDKNELHEELRGRVRTDLLPWCEGCGSHHVAPMLWRFALVRVGARRGSRHRDVRGGPGEGIFGAEAARRLLRFYGPATAAELEGWAGLAGRHARRLWQEIEGDVTQVDGAAVLAEDVA